MQFFIKCLVSGILVGGISEISKKSTFVGAITASLPLTSILAIIWLYHETKSIEKIILLSNGIAWIVLPSIVFFVALSLLLRHHFNFYLSLPLSIVIMSITYFLYSKLLATLNI